MSNQFRVLLSTDNAAFEDGRDFETARILRDVAGRLENGESGGTVRDINGNRVGDYGFQIEGTMP